MEEVRRDLMKRFGETADDGPNSVYAGGLWVRTSMMPKMQDAAAEALREGLAKFDGGRGWRDTGLSIDVSGDWQTQLRVAALGTGFPDWKKAVVLSKSGNSASIGFSDGSTGSLPESAARQAHGELRFQESLDETLQREQLLKDNAIIVKAAGPERSACRAF